MLQAPLLPFWEVFPQEGSASENGVYGPGKAAIYWVPVQCSSNWSLMHAGTIPLKLLLGVDLSVSLKMLVISLIYSINILV